jgi:hypothetical protein
LRSSTWSARFSTRHPSGTTPAHPDALLLGGGDLAPDPLASDLPLELDERLEKVRRQSSVLAVVLNVWITETNET